MTTVRDTIDDAIETALKTIDQIVAVEFDPAGEPNVFPDLAVFRGPDREIEREAHLTRREGLFSVDGTVSGADRDAVRARTGLHAAAVAAIMADPTLGGVVELIDPADCRWYPSPLASEPQLSFSQDFIIQFVTARDNPALPA